MEKDNISPSIQELVGVYELTGAASVWHEKLTLDNNNNFLLEHWRDIGGKWKKLLAGKYIYVQDHIILDTQQKRPDYSVLILDTQNELKKIILIPIGKKITERFLNVFIKLDYPKNIKCIADNFDGNNFRNSLTIGKTYLATECDSEKETMKIINDRNKTRIYPKQLFETV